MRVLLEVTDLDTRQTRYITVTGGAEVPELVAGYALRYARLAAGLPPTELPWEDPNVPLALSLFPAEEEPPTDDAA